MKLVSNSKSFRIYVWFRHFTLLLIVLFLLSLFFENKTEMFSQYLAIIGSSLLIPLILYEYFHYPNYLRVQVTGADWKIDVFSPDTRFHFLFTRDKIRSYKINKSELETVHLSQHFFGWHKRLTIVTRREEHLESLTVSLDLFSAKEQEVLISLFQQDSF